MVAGLARRERPPGPSFRRLTDNRYTGWMGLRNRLGALGLATKADLAKLERKINATAKTAKKANKAATAKKATAAKKKPAAKRKPAAKKKPAGDS